MFIIKAYDVIDSNVVFKGKIIDVVQDTLHMPNGKTAMREVVIRGEASAVLPVDANGNIIFVRQYRHPIKDYVLEIPAGMLDGDEDPKICALRELEEETGYKASQISHFTSLNTSVGFCTELIHIYFAEGLYNGEQNLDDDEFVTIERYSLEKAIEMVYNGAIFDSKTIIAILGYAYSHLLKH